jgi:hypothetical protein
MTTIVETSMANGMVRSTAFLARLRASPAPRMLRVSPKACSIFPPGGVPGDEGGRAGGHVGGDQGEVVAVGGVLVAGQDEPDRDGLEGPVPQAGDLGDVLDLVAAVGADRARFPCAGLRDVPGLAEAGALRPGPSALAGAGRGGCVQLGVAGDPAGPGDVRRQFPQRRPVVGGVGDGVHRPVRERGREQADQRRGGIDLGRASLLLRRFLRGRLPGGGVRGFRACGALLCLPVLLLGHVEADQDGQADLPAAERDLDQQRDGDEAVAVAQLAQGGAAAVVLPCRAVDLAPGPPEHRVVDRDPQVSAGRDQEHHRDLRDAQAELVDLPAGAGKEVVRPVMRPQAVQARAQQHPGHRPAARLPGQARGQAAERHERRSGEARTQSGQDLQQRPR